MNKINQLVVFGLALLLSLNAAAFSMERFVEGVHYKTIGDAPVASKTVIEFFSFGCPHCNHLEPHVEEWLKAKPDTVKFERVPATWNKKFQVLAQLYYSLEALDKLGDNVPKTFDYIHKQGRHIHTQKEALDYMASLGISAEDAEQVWQSEGVKSKVQTAGALFSKYQVRGVPAILVNGKYQTSVSMAGSEKELFEVVNFLLNK